MDIVDVDIVITTCAPIPATAIIAVTGAPPVVGNGRRPHAHGRGRQPRGQPGAGVIVGRLVAPGTGVGIVGRGVTIGGRGRNVRLRAGIARIVITGAVDHRAVVHVGAGVARGVAHGDRVRGGIVHLDVFGVIVGVAGRDLVHLLGRACRNLPGAVGRVGLIPDPLVQDIVLGAFFEHGLSRVHRVFQVRAGDLLELGVPGILHLGGGLFPVDGCGLGDGVVQDRFLGLGSAGHVYQDKALHRVFRNFSEISGELVRRHVAPGARGQGLGLEPAAGGKGIIILGLGIHENIAVSIADV
ncbi:MAG: hypothetical protein C4567_00005 [Deltaproteobacteria bacterium]|nr:MAG: hypothetical protein C4567_00005 [Deltaproteobacteria bacterium]